MIVDLRLCKNIKHFSLIERFQILSLADCAVAASRVVPDRLVGLLLHATPAFTIGHVDDLLRQRSRRRRNNPPRGTVKAKHWKNKAVTTLHKPATQPRLL